MKKIALLLFVLFSLASCSGDDAGPTSANFTSNAVLNGTAFNPNQGTYYEGGPDTHRHLVFTVREPGASGAVMNIDLFVPFSQQGVSGSYNMSIGEADDALASVYLNMDGDSYYISASDYLQVTDLGNSRFRFEFTNGYGIIFQQEPVPFAGTIEGTFSLVEN